MPVTGVAEAHRIFKEDSMLKQIHICSRREFSWLLRSGAIDPAGCYALISSSYPPELPEGTNLGYCFRNYDDIDYDCPGRSFSPEDAKSFADAIRNLDEVQKWYFVCDAGCRRSAAVACSALRYWGREVEELAIWNDPGKEPNVLVYEMLCNALGVDIVDDALDLRIHMNRSAIRAAFGRKRI